MSARPGGFGAWGGVQLLKISWVLLMGAVLTGSALAQQPYTTDTNTMLLYHLDETSGTVAADSSGNARNATYGSAVTLGAPGPSAVMGQAIHSTNNLSGRTTWLDSGSGSNSFLLPENTPSFTMEAWLKLDSVPTNQQAIVTVQPTLNPNADYQFQILGGNVFNPGALAIADSSGTLRAFTPGGLTWVSNQWYHIALVTAQNGTNSTYKFYQTSAGVTNAQLVWSQTGNAIVDIGGTTDRQFEIGNFYGDSGTRNIQGFLDEVRFSNVARNAADFGPTLMLPIPEPSVTMLGLMGLGLVAVVLRRISKDVNIRSSPVGQMDHSEYSRQILQIQNR